MCVCVCVCVCVVVGEGAGAFFTGEREFGDGGRLVMKIGDAKPTAPYSDRCCCPSSPLVVPAAAGLWVSGSVGCLP